MKSELTTDVNFREIVIDGETYCVGRMRLEKPIPPLSLEDAKTVWLVELKEDD